MQPITVTGVTLSGAAFSWAAVRQANKKRAEKMFSGQALLPLDESALEDPSAVGAAIRAQCPFLRGPVSIGIPSDEALLRVMRLPTTDAAEVRSMIELQMDKISPFPEEKMAVSHEILFSDADSTLAAVIAARREQIEKLGAVCRAAGIEPCRIDANAMAWWLILAKARAGGEAGGRQMAIVPDGGGMLLIVVQDRLPVCFRALTPADGLAAEEYAFETAQELHSLLAGLDAEYGPRPLTGLSYWRRPDEDTDTAEKLGEMLNVKTAVKDASALPSACEGLAARALEFLRSKGRGAGAGGGAIDLVPQQWRETAAAKKLKRALITASCVAVGLWLIAAAVLFAALHNSRRVLAKEEQALAALRKEADAVLELRRRVSALEAQLDQQYSALECITEFSRLVPDSIALTSFQYQRNKHVIVKGECLATEPIYEFKEALDKSGLFTGISMAGGIQPQQRKNTTVHVFQMIAALRGAEP